MGALDGTTILLTRSEESNVLLARQLEQRGARVVSLPTIEFTEPVSWHQTDEAIRNLQEYQGLLFTSKTAVERFLRRVTAIDSQSTELLRGLKAYAVGEKTEEVLVREGFKDIVTPDVSTAEGMAESLSAHDLSGKRFLFPKSDIARDVLPKALRERNALVDEVIVYRTVPPLQKDLDRIRDALLKGTISVTTFFSPSAVRHFVQMLGAQALSRAAVATIGPTTAKTVEGFGVKVSILPEYASSESLLDSIEQFFHPSSPKHEQ